MNCYDLTLELIRVMSDIDRAVEEKGRTRDNNRQRILNDQIDRLEVRMYEIKNILKAKQI